MKQKEFGAIKIILLPCLLLSALKFFRRDMGDYKLIIWKIIVLLLIRYLNDNFFISLNLLIFFLLCFTSCETLIYNCISNC